MVDLEIVPYLKADDFAEEADIEFLTPGEYVEIKLDDGTMKRVFNIDIALPDGNVRRWSPNITSQTTIARKFGTKTTAWVHKRWTLMKIKQNVRGQIKDVILARP